MPYEIQKSIKPRGWFVIKKSTGEKIHNKVHKTKKEAMAHLTALNTNINDYQGEGLFGDIKDNILGRFSGARNDYPPKVRKLLSKIGLMKIKNIVIYRTPVQSFVKRFLNILSFGAFQKKLQQRGFDEVFHLYIRVDLMDFYGNQLSIRVEKNHVINISVWDTGNDEVKNKMNLIMPNATWNKMGGLTLNDFLNNAKQAMGDKYFKYSAFNNNNCQTYILNLLQANGILDLNPQAKSFIYQDMGTLGQEIGITSGIAQGLTNIAGIGDTLIYGKGLF